MQARVSNTIISQLVRDFICGLDILNVFRLLISSNEMM